MGKLQTVFSNKNINVRWILSSMQKSACPCSILTILWHWHSSMRTHAVSVFIAKTWGELWGHFSISETLKRLIAWSKFFFEGHWWCSIHDDKNFVSLRLLFTNNLWWKDENVRLCLGAESSVFRVNHQIFATQEPNTGYHRTKCPGDTGSDLVVVAQEGTGVGLTWFE